MISRPDKPTAEPTLQVIRQVMGRTIVLTLQGTANTTCIDDLEDQLAQSSALRPQHVLLDLSHLGTIADLVSATLSAFANTVRHNGGSVRYVMQPLRRSA